MSNLRQIVDGKVITAYGTSEGVSKAWDTRGRGRQGYERATSKFGADQKHIDNVIKYHNAGRHDKADSASVKIKDPDAYAHAMRRIGGERAHFKALQQNFPKFYAHHYGGHGDEPGYR